MFGNINLPITFNYNFSRQNVFELLRLLIGVRSFRPSATGQNLDLAKDRVVNSRNRIPQADFIRPLHRGRIDVFFSEIRL